MKIFIFTIAALLFSVKTAFAHEEGTEVTNLAEADWIGPLIAIIIIAGAIIIARAIRARPRSRAKLATGQVEREQIN